VPKIIWISQKVDNKERKLSYDFFNVQIYDLGPTITKLVLFIAIYCFNFLESVKKNIKFVVPSIWSHGLFNKIYLSIFEHSVIRSMLIEFSLGGWEE
jgi:hypothetical protein